jgi:FkbM family methyltransferase
MLLSRTIERIVDFALIKDTVFYKLYLRFRHPRRYAAMQQEYAFYNRLISEAGSGLVFDIGANRGEKAVIFAQSATRVVCVEPSPASVSGLRRRFRKFPAVSIVGKGVGAFPSTLPFSMFGDSDCYNTFSTKWATAIGTSENNGRPRKEKPTIVDVPVITLNQLIDHYGHPSYIKIDVEGFEHEVIKGLTQPVNLISIECNLPEFESETLESISRLDAIQYNAQFNYCLTEPPSQFAAEQWLSQPEMAQVVKSGGHDFMEIYCRSTKLGMPPKD